MKITIGTLSNRGFRPKTVKCLLELVAKGGYEFHIAIAEHGYTIAENRNWIVVKALNNESDYVLFIDDDMVFPASLLESLWANDKDIVGVAYHPRCATSEKLGFLDETHIISLENTTDPKYKDTFECKAVGTGVMLVKIDVFKKMQRPWFDFKYLPTGQCEVGEDWYFCSKAKELDYKIWCDPKIKIGHLGEKEF